MKKENDQKRKGRKMGIFPKTFLAVMTLFTVMILLVHGLVYGLMSQTYATEKQEQAKENLGELERLLSRKTAEEIRKIAEDFVASKNVNLNLKIDGKVQHIQGFAGADIVTDGLLGSELVPLVDAEQMGSILISNTEVYDSNGEKVLIQMLSNVESLKEASEATLKILPYSLSISAIVALFFSYFYSRLMVKPIRKIAETTRKMQEMAEVRCDTLRGDEIGELARDINKLYQNLRETILKLEEEKEQISRLEREKIDLIRSASHELKTPLASLHVMLENMQLGVSEYKNHKKYLKEATAVVERMSGMVQEVLNSSKFLEGKTVEYQLVDVGDLLRYEVEKYTLLAKTRGLDFSLSLKKIFIKIDNKVFSKVLSNLISNAVKYAEVGSKIKIKCNEQSFSTWNQCEPINPGEIKKLFDPFYRSGGEETAEGNGMGLYFVKNNLTKLGLDFEFKPWGQGMKFEIFFKERK